MNMIVLVIAFLISIAASIYGIRNVLKKGVPLYFQIIVCAASLYALEALSSLAVEYCGGSEEVMTVSALGLWGCLWFLFCANHGAMNGLIYDGQKPGAVLYVVPLAHSLAIIFIGYTYYKTFGDLVAAILVVIEMAPAVPVLFWNFAHLNAKEDPFGIRSKIKGCDLASIVFNVLFVVLNYSRAVGGVFEQAMLIVCPCAIAWLAIEAVKGARSWNI